MSLTEQQKEIALRVAGEISVSAIRDTGDSDVLEFATRFLAALPKPKPVGKVDHGRYRDIEWLRQPPPSRTLLYTEAPITPPASEQKPVDPWMNTNSAFLNMKRAEQDALHGKAMDKLTEMVRSAQSNQPDYKAQRDALLKSVAQVKSNLMHHRRFGCDTFQAWKNSAARAEGDLEEAIASVKGGE